MKRYIYIIIGIVVAAAIVILILFLIKNHSRRPFSRHINATGSLPATGAQAAAASAPAGSGGSGVGASTLGLSPITGAARPPPRRTDGRAKLWRPFKQSRSLIILSTQHNTITAIEPTGR